MRYTYASLKKRLEDILGEPDYVDLQGAIIWERDGTLYSDIHLSQYSIFACASRDDHYEEVVCSFSAPLAQIDEVSCVPKTSAPAGQIIVFRNGNGAEIGRIFMGPKLP